MSEEDSSPRIEITGNRNELAGQSASMGSMTFVVFVIALSAALFQNQWGAFSILVFFIGIGLAAQLAEKWFAQSTLYRLGPDHFAIDGADLELACIERICWPTKTKDKRLRIGLFFRKREDAVVVDDDDGLAGDEPLCSIDIQSLEYEDRLLMIRYLQKQDCEQLNWAEFCSLYLEGWLARPRKLFSDRFNERLESAPFWTGFIYTPYIAAACLFSVSSYLYFLVGTTVAVSGLINVRMMHGQWFSPVGEMILGGAAFVILLGIVTNFFPSFKRKRELSSSEQKASHQSALVFASVFVLGPLAIQVLAINGWRLLAQLLSQTLPLVPIIPMVLERTRDRKIRRERADEALPDVVEKWEAYCEEFLGGGLGKDRAFETQHAA